MTQTQPIPILDTQIAASVDDVCAIVLQAVDEETAVYPLGGSTALNLGLTASRPGTALQMPSLNKIVDFPARDMTITVEAGVSMQRLQQTLAPEGQRLPIDAPQAEAATLGGLIATNHSGPLRFGHGTVRDHVIGIRAVNGLGEPFAAGGRVVKNVAGYDFCKLLTGSLGTLGVITEVTLKLKPIPKAQSMVVCRPKTFEHAERILAALIDSKTTPVVVELLHGASWEQASLGEATCGWLVVGFEGTQVEVDWMTDQLCREWRALDAADPTVLRDQAFTSFYQLLLDFPADDGAALVVQATGVPSGTVPLLESLSELEGVEVQAHAGDGVLIAKFAEWPDAGLAATMSSIRSLASQAHGYATILSNPSGGEMTHQAVWGAASVPYDLMRKVKDAFDPHHVLNPGRFVY